MFRRSASSNVRVGWAGAVWRVLGFGIPGFRIEGLCLGFRMADRPYSCQAKHTEQDIGNVSGFRSSGFTWRARGT